jgi:cytochrome c oxidase cbb3-type subunit 4
MNHGLISGVLTALLLLSFIGVVAWAWSARRREQFDAAARLPLDEAEDSQP